MEKTRYIEGIGRRKTSTARVRITPSSKIEFVVNGKALNEYFTISELISIAKSPIVEAKLADSYSVSVHVNGGGISAQADAIRHGLARAIVKKDETLRGELKRSGFLKRDGRAKERKKFGLKKARKSPTWSKR